MGDLEKKAISILQATAEKIRANLEAKKINASGRTAASLRVEKYEGGVRLMMGGRDTAPVPTLEIGRGGGGVPGGFVMLNDGRVDVSNTFKFILIKWAENKGFELNWGGATMLGRRIAERGTLRRQQPENVYSAPVNEAKDLIRQELFMTVKQAIRDNFRR